MSKKLGNLIKEARTAKGLSQAALAEKVDGISASDVSKIERGEKEPVQDVIKQIAKVLGVTQKSLLDAATGSGKTTTAGKTTTGKTATGKTTAGKTSAKKPSAVKTAVEALTLTATEKKLVQLYRKADTKTKKAAINLLEGDSNMIELIGALMSSGKGTGSSGSSGTSDLLSALMSGKTGGSGSSGSSGKDTMSTLMEMLAKMNK
ncbi:MAG: helix-turn-helix transcriptional regulator [Oscillospiraceae bacterium]|nr:helix-turn-helix transcriptional regulator [Oscillospiraceae bacterium]